MYILYTWYTKPTTKGMAKQNEVATDPHLASGQLGCTGGEEVRAGQGQGPGRMGGEGGNGRGERGEG